MTADEATGHGVRITVEDGVLGILLNRPEARNAISRAMADDIADALGSAADRADVRVAVISGAGGNFCTGMDLAESNRRSATPLRVGSHQRRIAAGAHRLIYAVAGAQVPVIAAVRGWTVGAGFGLALAADAIVADETARFWAPYTARGFSPDSGTTYFLPRVVGTMRAKHILMRAEPVHAALALEWGLVAEVVSAAELDEAVARLAGEFTRGATVSLGLARSLVHRNLDTDLAAALRNEEFAEEVALRSKDFKEGMAALQERRPTSFTGL